MNRLARILGCLVLAMGVLVSSVIGSVGMAGVALAAGGNDREDPLAVGETGTVGDYTVKVLEVTPDATDIVMAENQFNDPPKDGNQFLIARIALEYTGAESGTPTFEVAFKVVGSSGVAYSTFDDYCGVVPDSLNDAPELFEGGTVELNLCWSVSSADVDSLVMYAEPFFSSDNGRTWFSLGNDAAATTGTPAAAAATRTTVKESSRKQPIPVGSVGIVGDYEVAVLEVTPDALDAVMAENQFNDPPKDGNQFYMVRVEVTYVGKDAGSPGTDLNFQAVGAGNRGYTTFEDSCGVIPESDLTLSDVFPDGRVEYNVCWQVAADDADSLVMFVEPLFNFDNDRTWFSLEP